MTIEKEPKQSVWMCAKGHYHNDMENFYDFGVYEDEKTYNLCDYFIKKMRFQDLPNDLRQEYLTEAKELIKAGL